MFLFFSCMIFALVPTEHLKKPKGNACLLSQTKQGLVSPGAAVLEERGRACGGLACLQGVLSYGVS